MGGTFFILVKQNKFPQNHPLNKYQYMDLQ